MAIGSPAIETAASGAVVGVVAAVWFAAELVATTAKFGRLLAADVTAAAAFCAFEGDPAGPSAGIFMRGTTRFAGGATATLPDGAAALEFAGWVEACDDAAAASVEAVCCATAASAARLPSIAGCAVGCAAEPF